MTAARQLANVVTLALLLGACTAPAQPGGPHQPLTIRAAELNAAEIPDGPIKGSLLGVPFSAADARFHLIAIPGHERTDLLIAEKTIASCGIPGQPVDDRSRRVWIRLPGQAALRQGELRVEPNGAGPISAHFEVFDDGQWRGIGSSATLLVIEPLEKGLVNTAISACFDDGHASCVKGRIKASTCRSSIDLDMLGERHTGLDEERP